MADQHTQSVYPVLVATAAWPVLLAYTGQVVGITKPRKVMLMQLSSVQGMYAYADIWQVQSLGATTDRHLDSI